MTERRFNLPHGVRRVLIVGLGKTGLSCARFLAASGLELAVTDTRLEPPGLAELRADLPDVAVFVGGFDEAAFRAADLLVVSPGVSLREAPIAAAIARGVPAIGDIELFARHADAPVAAITGANGKSTVTTLLGEMARAAGLDVRVGGNLGTPALDLLDGARPDLYVLELSSFQLETVASLDARAAVVLNITPDHMDRYDAVEDYAAAKRRVYRGTGAQIINADDPLVAAMAEPGRRVIRFTLGVPADGEYGLRRQEGEMWLAHGTELLLALAELRIAGQHNAANALAALALADALGLPLEPCLVTLREFAGLPHRCQWVAQQDGITWYNDSKGTNVGATLAAIHGLPGTLVLILGGIGKGADFSPLREAMHKVRAAVLIGRDAPLIAQALEDSTTLVHADSMAEAVAEARRLAQPGDSVLLSPACASFDMFTGYDHRGNVFAAAVKELLK